MGRLPTPTPILKARGSWRAKGRAGEPNLPPEKPSCPDWLTGEGRAEWDRQAEELMRMGVLAKADRGALAMWCVAWADLVEAVKFIADAKNGGPYSDECGRAQRMKRAAMERLVSLAAHFGFTPAMRSRLRVAGGEEGKGGPSLDDFKIA